ncbi:MAG: ABC transporter permease [bacterium]|nr:ABC transporter permease [bacterium]
MATQQLQAAHIAATEAPSEEPPVWRQVLHSLSRNPVAFAGAIILIFMVVIALVPDWFAPYNPFDQDPQLGPKPPFFLDPATGRFHVLGTDAIGRDLLSRIIHGARVSLTVGLSTVFVAGTIGVLVGLVSGYNGGWTDTICMRIVDIFLAFPFILLALTLIAILRPSLMIVILVISIRTWIVYARVVRGAVLSIKEQEFVVGAMAAGLGPLGVMFKYILPNALPPAIVIATLSVGRMILIEASLSFLGLGVPPPSPTWGGILADGRQYIDTAWWICLFPGMAIMLTVLSANLLGDWLRDFLDPRLKTLE